MNTKRLLAAILWFYAGWTAAAFAAMIYGFDGIVGPLAGTVAAAFFAGDPLHMIWHSRLTTKPATARLASVNAPN